MSSSYASLEHKSVDNYQEQVSAADEQIKLLQQKISDRENRLATLREKMDKLENDYTRPIIIALNSEYTKSQRALEAEQIKLRECKHELQLTTQQLSDINDKEAKRLKIPEIQGELEKMELMFIDAVSKINDEALRDTHIHRDRDDKGRAVYSTGEPVITNNPICELLSRYIDDIRELKKILTSGHQYINQQKRMGIFYDLLSKLKGKNSDPTSQLIDIIDNINLSSKNYFSLKNVSLPEKLLFDSKEIIQRIETVRNNIVMEAASGQRRKGSETETSAVSVQRSSLGK